MLNGLPTFFLVLLLTFCVKFLYLKPLSKVLDERHRLTEGARIAAEESLRNADTKISEYEQSLMRARQEIYAEQGEFLKKLHDEQAERVRAARSQAEARTTAARASIAQETTVARQNLEAQSDTLAAQIADAILNRRVA